MSKKRKYFGTDGIRGYVGEGSITPDFVMKLGWAVGRVLAQKGGSKVLIGKDTRISGYMFESALEAGLSAAGVNIHLLGPMPTPAIAYLTRTLRAQAGIVISASHNPYYDNGIKFFSAQGSKLPDEVEIAIEQQLEQAMTIVDSIKLGRASRIPDARGRYIEFCKSTVPSNFNLRGIKMVIDCANGATYHVAPNVFEELGAEVIAINVKPNGININEKCGSTRPDSLRERVLAEGADLGIAFDGDGDRVIMVDAKGEIVDGDEIVFIIAKNSLPQHQAKHGVVGTVMSNFGLELALRDLGLDFTRAKVGDRYVLAELQRRGWQLGGETSGHIICLAATTTGDGIVAALQVLLAMVQSEKTLHELKSGMQKFPQTMINIKCAQSIDLHDLPHTQHAVKMLEEKLAGHGRVLLRTSGTEPLIRVMVEGQNDAQVAQLAQELAAVVMAEVNG